MEIEAIKVERSSKREASEVVISDGRASGKVEEGFRLLEESGAFLGKGLQVITLEGKVGDREEELLDFQ